MHKQFIQICLPYLPLFAHDMLRKLSESNFLTPINVQKYFIIYMYKYTYM